MSPDDAPLPLERGRDGLVRIALTGLPAAGSARKVPKVITQDEFVALALAHGLTTPRRLLISCRLVQLGNLLLRLGLVGLAVRAVRFARRVDHRPWFPGDPPRAPWPTARGGKGPGETGRVG